MYKEKTADIKEEFHEIFKREEENRRYFDRTYKRRMCSKDGEFECIDYEKGKCRAHSINPYRSRAEMLLFSGTGLWTLDHM